MRGSLRLRTLRKRVSVRVNRCRRACWPILLTLPIAAIAGCASIDRGRVDTLWDEVKAEYPGVERQMPKVVWTNDDIVYIKDGEKVWCYGAYISATNTVYLRDEWAGEKTIIHEFRHACGDRLGEKDGTIKFDSRK